MSESPSRAVRVGDGRSAQAEQFLARKAIHDAWRSDYLNPSLEPFYDLAFQRVREALGAGPGTRLLDAGCGSCMHAARFARAGISVVGVDFSAAALDDARAQLRTAGLEQRVELRQADLRALPFADGEFRAISCWGVLMHVPDLEAALDELARVLAPHGRLAIMENNARSLHVRWVEPTLRVAKRMLGRSVAQVARNERGVEEWRATPGAAQGEGGLMVRKLDPRWLEQAMAQRGLRLVQRFAGQFTELYTSLPARPLKRAVFRFNHAWLARGRSPALAMGNVFVFEK